VSALADLRARVEAATGADRVLDWQVGAATGHSSFDHDSALWPPFREGSRAEKAVPAYTASLDAVLALVGEKLPGWHVNELHQRPDEPLWWADLLVREIEGPPGDEPTWRANAHAATPALALLSALLAALDASGWHGQGPMSTTDDCRVPGTQSK